MLFIVVACGPRGGSPIAVDGPLMVQDDHPGNVMDAGIGGYVNYIPEGDCFTISTKPGRRGMSSIAVWPQGTTLEHDGDEIVGLNVPDAGFVPVNARITGGGGILGYSSAEGFPEVTDQCSPIAEYAIIDSVEEVERRRAGRHAPSRAGR